jgi:hypothetical protein
MKTSKPLFALLLFLVTFQLLAQNPLVGTWRLVSAVHTDENGKATPADVTQMKEMS